jgi:hypothetical protein
VDDDAVWMLWVVEVVVVARTPLQDALNIVDGRGVLSCRQLDVLKGQSQRRHEVQAKGALPVVEAHRVHDGKHPFDRVPFAL